MKSFPLPIILEAALNGLLTGAIYALVALGLTLVYGVLHIVNFAHGALLTLAMYAVFLVFQLGIDPYLALIPLSLAFFAIGYALQYFIIEKTAKGDDNQILLVTLGLSIIIENALLASFKSDTRTIATDYAYKMVEMGKILVSYPRLIGFGVAMVVALFLWFLMVKTNLGRAIRAVAKEKLGARLVGLNVRHLYAMTFGIGCACLAIAACLLMPMYYVSPRVGNSFVLVAFTIVVLGGMGSVTGCVIAAFIIGLVEALCGLYLGESLGQIGIFLIFVVVLILRPQGILGAKQ